MRRLSLVALSSMLVLLLTACGGNNGGNNNTGGGASNAPAGFEIYTETGGVPVPRNAVNISIVYSPESQEYMPELIRQFNQSYADGINPVTGAELSNDDTRIYVWGTDPVSGSSGTVMQGIVNAIVSPNNDNVYRPTIFQPSVSHWLALANFYSGQELFDIADSPGTALSPVVIAAWESRVEAIEQTTGKDRSELGWQDFLDVFESDNGWCDYNLEDCRRAVYYGHADPNHSSTGLSTTIAQFYACARENDFQGRRLTEDAVRDRDIQACVTEIQTLARHYSRRTEDFLEYVGEGSDYLDFLAMEETDVICINTGGSQGDIPCVRPGDDEKLIAVYPVEGTYWHEHPFGIVNASWVSDEQRSAARTFTDWMLTAPVQEQVMRFGYRPAHPDVMLDFPFSPENGVSEAGPSSTLDVPEAESVVAIQGQWANVKKRADVTILLDVSGSMGEDNKIGQALQGIDLLMDEMPSANQVSLVTFENLIRVWDPLEPAEINKRAIEWHVTCKVDNNFERSIRVMSFPQSCIREGGGTSLFTATRIAVDMLDSLSTDGDRIRLVLLLSDGQDTCQAEGCSTLDDVISKIEITYASPNPIIVIPVAYGDDADMIALQRIADASRTRVFRGDPENILDLLTLLSGYF